MKMDIRLSDKEEVNSDEIKRQVAVALKGYGVEEKHLPTIVASGYGKLAEKIVRLAFDNGVKVREDGDLAKILAAIEVDSEIPAEALVAVAEILSYVYKANGTYSASGEGKNG